MHLRYLFSFQDPNAVKLSRLEILRRTCKYIVFLMKMIDFLKQEAEEREQQQQYQIQEPLTEGHYLMQQQHLMEPPQQRQRAASVGAAFVTKSD